MLIVNCHIVKHIKNTQTKGNLLQNQEWEKLNEMYEI